MLKVELFFLPGCSRCDDQLEPLREVVAACGGDRVHWRELDLLQNIDAALDLGILSAPALAIDGVLVFASLPTPEQLNRELRNRILQ